MQQTSVKCAACGEDATGKFCNNCGASLTPQSCTSCEAPLSAGARFCHLCGTPTAASKPSGTPATQGNNVAWIVAGVVSVALIVVIGMQFVGNNPATPPQTQSPVAAQAPAPDISNMTPRQRADRLFERIMIADTRGFPDTVAFFTPMALQAYALLPDFDIDARYHVGLIQGLAGNEAAVRAQSDSIRAEEPNHLMAPMLDFALARLLDDSAGMVAAYNEFLMNYPSEIGIAREEYAAHQTALESFRQDAAAATNGPEPVQPL